jgi:hypothetical protein
VAEALFDHQRVRGQDALGDAPQVHIDHVVPVGRFVLADLSGDADPGVVEQVIQTTRFGKRILHN